MRIMPKVTYDLKEYNALAHDNADVSEPSVTIHGLYFNGIIWCRGPSALTMSHEFTHHVTQSIGGIGCNGDIRLFIDFLDTFYDTIWCFMRFSANRKRVWVMIDSLREAWDDFLNFHLCRDMGV